MCEISTGDKVVYQSDVSLAYCGRKYVIEIKNQNRKNQESNYPD